MIILESYRPWLIFPCSIGSITEVSEGCTGDTPSGDMSHEDLPQFESCLNTSKPDYAGKRQKWKEANLELQASGERFSEK